MHSKGHVLQARVFDCDARTFLMTPLLSDCIKYDIEIDMIRYIVFHSLNFEQS